MIGRLALVALLACAAACNLDSWDNAHPLETPQDGMPCGAAWHKCKNTAVCCANTTACQGDGTCETIDGRRMRARPAPEGRP